MHHNRQLLKKYSLEFQRKHKRVIARFQLRDALHDLLQEAQEFDGGKAVYRHRDSILPRQPHS